MDIPTISISVKLKDKFRSDVFENMKQMMMQFIKENAIHEDDEICQKMIDEVAKFVAENFFDIIIKTV